MTRQVPKGAVKNTLLGRMVSDVAVEVKTLMPLPNREGRSTDSSAPIQAFRRISPSHWALW